MTPSASSKVRRTAVRLLVGAYLVVIAGVPSAFAALLVATPTTYAGRLLGYVFAPVVFAVAYVLTAGLLSRLTLRAMVAGRYPRDLGHPVYGPRRLHALCWTAIYYCTPLYHAVLAVPLLKRLTFRLFGYRGSLDVTLYPDSWVRDLPLLTIGEGAYVSNRATLGTNMCLMDGTVMVSPVTIGKGAMIGHLAMLAPGTVVGEQAEISVGCAIGISVSVGRRARIGPTTSVHHGAVIGERCDIGAMCLIGLKAVIHPGVHVPAGTVVPPRATIRTEADLQRYSPSVRASSKSSRDALLENQEDSAPSPLFLR